MSRNFNEPPDPLRYRSLYTWAADMHAYLIERDGLGGAAEETKPLRPGVMQGGESAVEQGVIMVDPTTGRLVVSTGTAWEPIALLSDV